MKKELAIILAGLVGQRIVASCLLYDDTEVPNGDSSSSCAAADCSASCYGCSANCLDVCGSTCWSSSPCSSSCSLFDLGNVQFSLQTTVGAPSCDVTCTYPVEICINKIGSGITTNYVHVSNLGTAPLNASFAVTLGLYDFATSQFYEAPDRLTFTPTPPLVPGEYADWTSPFCTQVGPVVPQSSSGQVYVAVYADKDNAISETDETNNFIRASVPAF